MEKFNKKEYLKLYNRQYRKDHPDYMSNWHKQNKERQDEYQLQYRKDHKDKIAAKNKKYQGNNRNKINAGNRARATGHRKNKTNQHLLNLMRARFAMALKNKRKTISISSVIGLINISDIRKSIESKFILGMTWQNHGTEWHIDHIWPMRIFDPNNTTHMCFAFSTKNLQPLWKRDNLLKSDKLPSSHFPFPIVPILRPGESIDAQFRIAV